MNHHFVQTNGIRMHYAEAGTGPLVVLCHGFPESWYSWRHQLGALAQAGFRVVAPDLRGYGQTDRPDAVEAYDIFQLTGDLVGLVNALSESSAVIVGHDWGAMIASRAALFRPDLFHALALLSVPYVPRGPIAPTEWEKVAYPGKIFYQAMLRSPGADAYFNANPRARLLAVLYTLSGTVSEQDRWLPARGLTDFVSDFDESKRPAWVSKEDLDFFESEFKRTGFTGGLNYYRNVDRNWAMTPFHAGAKIVQPTLFIAGDKDPVIDFARPAYDAMEANVPNLSKKILLPGVGHWTQQESPDEVNRLLIEFLVTAGAKK
jgi:pimeloyl-ACP methyl ester carboxylesterase